MRSGSDAGISPSPAQLLFTFAKLLFEKVITTMDTLIEVPRFALLKKLARREKQAVGDHLSVEDMAAYVSGNLGGGARRRAERHLAACEVCRKMVKEIVCSEMAVKDVDEPST